MLAWAGLGWLGLAWAGLAILDTYDFMFKILTNFEHNSIAVCDSCVFPFIYNGTTYDKCTDADSNQLWCSTLTDVNNNLVEDNWTYCNGHLCQNTGKSLIQIKSTWSRPFKNKWPSLSPMK
jgi:hypothetical protein